MTYITYDETVHMLQHILRPMNGTGTVSKASAAVSCLGSTEEPATSRREERTTASLTTGMRPPVGVGSSSNIESGW